MHVPKKRCLAAHRTIRRIGKRGYANFIKHKKRLQTPSKTPIIWGADNCMTETRLTFLFLLTGPKKCVVRILQALMSETVDRQEMPHSTARHRSAPDDVQRRQSIPSNV